MRVVLDTNVLISAFLFGGRLAFIVDHLAKGVFEPCFSQATWEEFKHTLQYPHLQVAFQKQDIAIEDILARLSVQSVFFPNTVSPFPIPHDKADEAILACALAASAKAVVTGDRHLLTLSATFPIPILTPRAFKEFISQSI